MFTIHLFAFMLFSMFLRWYNLRHGAPPDVEVALLDQRTQEMAKDRGTFDLIATEHISAQERRVLLGTGQTYDPEHVRILEGARGRFPKGLPADLKLDEVHKAHVQVAALESYATMGEQRAADAWATARAIGRSVKEQLAAAFLGITEEAERGNPDSLIIMGEVRAHDEKVQERQQSTSARIERATATRDEQVEQLAQRVEELAALLQERDRMLEEARHELALHRGRAPSGAAGTGRIVPR